MNSLPQANNCCGTTQVSEQAKTDTTSQARPTTVRPRVNIYESEQAFAVDVEMPGVDETQAEIVLEKNLLTVKGNSQPATREGFQRVYGFAHQYAFERTFQVPEGIDRDGLTASMKNGVLSITLPKAAQLQPQKVMIKAG